MSGGAGVEGEGAGGREEKRFALCAGLEGTEHRKTNRVDVKSTRINRVHLNTDGIETTMLSRITMISRINLQNTSLCEGSCS